MFDIKKVEAEARAEVTKEQEALAKSKVKAHLAKIAQAEAVLANLKREYAVLLASLGDDA